MQNDEEMALLNLNNYCIKKLLNELKHIVLLQYVELCWAGINDFHSHYLKRLPLEKYAQNFTS